MEIDNIKVHYRDEGDGFPLLLVHGAFSSLHTFDAWAEYFGRHYRVLRLTLPGFGLTGPSPDNSYSVSRSISCIRSFLRRLKIDECHIAGSSLGGWISWEYALAFPWQVRKLILIDAAGFMDESSIPVPFKMARLPFVDRVIKFAVKKSVLEQFVKQVYADKNLVTAEVVDRYYDLFTRPGNPEAFLAMANGRVKDNTPRLKGMRSQTLILWGEKDKWLPVRNAYRFQDLIPAAELIVYSDVGHLPMEEAPQRSAADVQAFLTGDLVSE